MISIAGKNNGMFRAIVLQDTRPEEWPADEIVAALKKVEEAYLR